MSTPIKPGWLMTVAQHATYFNLLGEVYAKDGIPPRDREAYRKTIHIAVFGEPISAKHIDRTVMFGKIKNHLLFLLDNVKGAVETDHPDHDTKRRLLNKIHAYYFPLLNVLLARASGSATGSVAVPGVSPGTPSAFTPAVVYARAITRARWKTDHLEDLTAERRITMRGGKPHEHPSDLEKLIMDLARAIQTKRKAADLTVHDLHAAADLPCPFNCLICFPKSQRATADNIPF